MIEWLFIFVAFVSCEKRADFIINEVNLGRVYHIDADLLPIGAEQDEITPEYIEIKKTSNLALRRNRQTVFKLLIIEKCFGKNPQLRLLAEPNFHSMVGDYWVLGDNNMRELIDMRFNDQTNVYIPGCPWQFFNQPETELVRCELNRVPDGSSCPVGILLVKLPTKFNRAWEISSRADVTRRFDFSTSYGFGKEIANGLEDMVIFYGEASYNHDPAILTHFAFFHQFAQQKSLSLSIFGRGTFVYAMRSQHRIRGRMMSLSRCESAGHLQTPFMPMYFYFCLMSPHAPNNCYNYTCSESMNYKLPVSEELALAPDCTHEETTGITLAPEETTEIDRKRQHGEEEQQPVAKRTRQKPDAVVLENTELTNRPAYTSEEKKMIIHAITYAKTILKCRTCEGLRADVLDMVQQITQVPSRSIERIWRQYKQNPDKLSGAQYKGGKKRIFVDEFNGAQLRRVVFQFYADKEFPTVRKLYAHFVPMMHNNAFPQMGTDTFYRLLRNVGFKYMKDNKKGFLYERYDITAMRHEYLRMMRDFRNQGYTIFYQDETWVHEHITHDKVWLLNPNKSSLLPAEKEGQGGMKVPSGAGRRLIVNHAGGAQGFLPNIKEVFMGVTGSGDYHREMNIEHWMDWYKCKVLRVLPDKSVFVVDNAKYHNQITEVSRRPTTAWRKAPIQEWLTKHNIAFEPGDIKAELLKKVGTVKTTKVYMTDKLAAETERDIHVLRLPIAHCELNPIELIWAWVKKQISDRNKTFKIKDVERITNDVLDEVSPELWEKCTEHVKKIEEEYWIRDGLLDNIEAEELVINNDDEEEEEDLIDKEDERLIEHEENGAETANTILQNVFNLAVH